MKAIALPLALAASTLAAELLLEAIHSDGESE